jgi:hypothetical protein
MDQARRSEPERGQIVVFLALLFPAFITLAAVVVAGGNWYTHAKHLQTKVDASALAGGSAWAFPCTSGSDAPITAAARTYVGPHRDAGGTLHTGGFNEQVGKVDGDSIEVRLNAADWFDDDAGVNPADFTTPSGPLCAAKTLDVKATEVNSFPLASIIPLFPDIKRKARIEIQESAGSSGPHLLPLAVRVPKPTNAAAVYVDETPGPTFGRILSAVYFNDVCEPAPGNPTCIAGMPTGLDHWTTDDGSGGNRATIDPMPSQVGVVIALSFRPRCPGTACFAINQATITELCNQGTSAIAQCFYATGTGTQTFRSGLQFIRSWSSNADPEPDLLSTWIEPPISGSFCYQGYFSAPVATPCTVTLRANIDPGFQGAGSYEIRYKHVSGDTGPLSDDPPGACNNNFGAGCVMGSGTAALQLRADHARHAVAIAIYRYGIPLAIRQQYGLPAQCGQPTPQQACSWYYTGAGRSQTDPSGNGGATLIFNNPVQRAFMGDVNKSGAVKYLHLKNVDCVSGAVPATQVLLTGEAASVPSGRRCFRLEMGLQGALAREQDEYPIQINIGATSQSAVVDCDPSKPNLKTEIEEGCGGPSYTRHDFAQADGNGTPYCPDLPGQNQFFSLPKAPPYDNWAPFTCVLTQSSASPNQVIQGFHQRLFGVQNNPSCPADDAPFKPGRNYWHDLNNSYAFDPDGPNEPLAVQEDFWTFTRTGRVEPVVSGTAQSHINRLRLDDPRFVTLFISPYNSFTAQGNDNYPLTGLGGFYITGYGRIQGNGNLINEDPCSTGTGTVGAGNTPPPDVDYSTSGAIAWGHFVVPVNLAGTGGGTGEPCPDNTPTTCVAVLVE